MVAWKSRMATVSFAGVTAAVVGVFASVIGGAAAKHRWLSDHSKDNVKMAPREIILIARLLKWWRRWTVVVPRPQIAT